MDTITFCAEAGIETTRLGFGTAGLFRESNKRRRFDVLAAALDSGIRHFDTAPIYGLGEAERALGEFFAARHERVTIATKFGLAIRSSLARLGSLQSVARQVLRSVPALRRVARRNATNLYESPRFDGHTARESLERSLFALRRDHVDALLLHECNPGALRDPELLRTLEDLRARGSVGAFGAATTFGHTLEMIASRPDLCRILQFDSDALNENTARLPAVPRSTLITHSVLSRSIREVGGALRADANLTARWSALVDEDLADMSVLSRLLIQIALRDNPRGIVLLHSNSPSHVRANVEASEATADRGQIERLSSLIHEFFAPAAPDRHAQFRQEEVRQ